MSMSEKHNVIDLIQPEKDESLQGQQPSKKIKPSPPNNDTNDDDDDEIQVVTGPSIRELFAPNEEEKKNETEDNDENDDGIQVVGTINTQSLPHLRCHCTIHKHKLPSNVLVDLTNENEHDKNKDNIKSCDLCYCYVCDVPVKECTEWNDHCNATDSSVHWQNVRKRKRPLPLTATMKDARRLKWIVDGIRYTIQQEVPTVCDANGISMDGMDNNLVSLAQVRLLARDFFDSYTCQQEFQTCLVDTHELFKKLKSVKKKNGTLTLSMGENVIQGKLEHAEKEEPPFLQMNLTEQDHGSPLSLPDISYSTCRMSTKEFRKIVEQQLDECCAASLNPQFHITIFPHGEIKFLLYPNHKLSASCGLVRASITLRDVPVVTTHNKPVMVVVPLVQLKKLVRVPFHVAPLVEICVPVQQFPLMLHYPLSRGENKEHSYIKFHLSPMVDE